MPHDLGLDDHPPLALPAPRGVPRLAVQVRRLAGGLGPHPGLAHQPPGPLLQAAVAGHRHDVLDLLLLEEREQLRVGKAPVQPDPKRRRRKGGAQLAQQPPQDPPGPPRGRGVARPQHRGHRELLGLVVEGHRRHDRQVAPRVVVAVEERELLLAVGRVVGGVQVDRDAGRPALEPPPLGLDHRVGQHVRHVAQRRPRPPRSRTATGSAARPAPAPRSDRGRPAACGSHRRPAGRRRCSRRSHRRARRRAAAPIPASDAGPCPAAARRPGTRPGAWSAATGYRGSSAAPPRRPNWRAACRRPRRSACLWARIRT